MDEGFLLCSAMLNFDSFMICLSNLHPPINYKDTNTHDYLQWLSPVILQKNTPYNLAKWVIVFVTDPEKVKLRINELRAWLKNNKYPDHIVSNAFYNAKLQGPAPTPKIKFNNIPYVTTFHKTTDNKIIMKNV